MENMKKKHKEAFVALPLVMSLYNFDVTIGFSELT